MQSSTLSDTRLMQASKIKLDWNDFFAR